MPLSNFVTNTDRRIFGIYGLHEETISYLFARYSRSKSPLRDLLQTCIDDGTIIDEPDWDYLLQHLTKGSGINTKLAPQIEQWIQSRNEPSEQAKAMHEKYTIGYGHSSVSEHMTLHFGIEGISILAAKAIEDCRLASYTEKSTRYVRWDAGDMYIPEQEFRLVNKAVNVLMETYDECLAESEEYFSTEQERLDAFRGLLPVAGLTSLGMTINARELRRMINKLNKSPYPEVRQIAGELRVEALKMAPTLLRYLDPPVEGFGSTPFSIEGFDRSETCVQKIQSGGNPTRDIGRGIVMSGLPQDYIESNAEMYFPFIPSGDTRSYELCDLTFMITCSYAAFRDLQRHRMSTMIVPMGMAPGVGYHIPEIIDDVVPHLRPLYEFGCDSAIGYAKYAASRDFFAAQYALPLAHYITFLWKMNIREAVYMVRLRTSKQAHPEYAEIAWMIGDIVNDYIDCDVCGHSSADD